jgi:threonine aldolase
MHRIDLRSDTVTQPTDAMRDVMARAEVGDDVYGEDPEVNRLQARVAELLGKPDALFFPSGTMANQAALRLHTRPGDVVLASRGAHILRAEAGAAAGLSGLQIETIGRGGSFDADDVRAAIPPKDVHLAPATLLAVENTHNTAGGRVFQPAPLAAAVEAARGAGLKTHLDGARLWNASAALDVSLETLAAPFDTVSVCLSKGLGAPAGSLVAGSREQVEGLRRIRKMYGGGMRQAGVLAAAGLYAVQHHRERLRDDHRSARRLADALEALGMSPETRPETNIVIFRVSSEEGFRRAAAERGVLLSTSGPGRVRAVTHLDISASDIEEAVDRLKPIVGSH